VRSSTQRLHKLEVVCLLAVMPFLLFPSPLSAPALLLLLLSWLVRWRALGRPTVRTPMDIPILCILLMLSVSLWASALPEVSLPKLLGIILGVAFFYGVVNSVKGTRGVWGWVGLLTLFGVGVACLSLIGTDWIAQKVLPLSPIYERLPRLIKNVTSSPGGGFHPNEVGGALALVLPVSLATCLAVWGSNPGVALEATYTVKPWAGRRVLLSRKASSLLATLSFTLMAGVFILTQSRSAYIGVATGLILLAISRNRWFSLSLPFLAAILLAHAWLVGAENFFDSMLMLDATGTAAGRFEVWQRAIYMIQDFPYTGIGLNMFPYVGDAMYPYFMLGPDARVPHAHNNFLQVAVDLGIPGLLAYLALVVTFCLCSWRVYQGSQSRSLRLLTVGLFSGMLAHQVYGLTDAITLGAKPGFMLWLMLGLMAALYNLEMGATLPSSPIASKGGV